MRHTMGSSLRGSEDVVFYAGLSGDQELTKY